MNDNWYVNIWNNSSTKIKDDIVIHTLKMRYVKGEISNLEYLEKMIRL